MKQWLAGRGKNIQMPIFINIIGDDAIKRAAAADGDIKAAMKYILQCLPPPRIVWLKALAMQAAIEIEGTRPSAARFLNVSERTICDKRISWVGLCEQLGPEGWNGLGISPGQSAQGKGDRDSAPEVDR